MSLFSKAVFAPILMTTVLFVAILFIGSPSWAQILSCRKAHTGMAEDSIGYQDARLAIQEAGNDPDQFWSRLHATLINHQIPHSASYYKAYFEEMFAASHSLVQQTENRSEMYGIFSRLLTKGFQRALERETQRPESNKDVERIIEYYSKQMWIPLPGKIKTETNLRVQWKSKVGQAFTNPEEAKSEGLNLAAHIKAKSLKNGSSINPQLYARFYFIVFSQFRVSEPAAFYQGLLGQSFAKAFPTLDTETQNFLQRGIRIAEQRHQIHIEIPKRKKQIRRAQRELENIQDPLDLPDTSATALSKSIFEKAQGDANVLTKLLTNTLRERELTSPTRRILIEQIFRGTQNWIFSHEDQLLIWESLRNHPTLNETFGRWLWGTTAIRPGIESTLRLYLKNLNSTLNASPDDQALALRRGDYLEKFIRSAAEPEFDRIYARLLYIALSERHFTNAPYLLNGLLNIRYHTTYSKLSSADQTLIQEGLNINIQNSPE